MKTKYNEEIEWLEDGKAILTVKEEHNIGDGKPATSEWSKETDEEELLDGLKNTEKTLLNQEKELTKTKAQLKELLQPFGGEKPKTTPKMRQIAKVLEKIQTVNRAEKLERQIEEQEQKVSMKHQEVEARKDLLSKKPEE